MGWALDNFKKAKELSKVSTDDPIVIEMTDRGIKRITAIMEKEGLL